MSRSDVWSAAITLFIAGIATTFIGTKWTGYGSMAIGGVTILVLLIWPRSEKPAAPNTATAKVDNTNAATNTNTNTFAPVVNFHSQPAPTPDLPELPARRRAEPNVRYQECEIARVEPEFGESGSCTGFRIVRNRDHNCALAYFRSVSRDSEPTAYVDSARASVRYLDENRKYLGRVNEACWAIHGLCSPSFGTEDQHAVILVVVDVDGRRFATHIEGKNDGFGYVPEVKELELPDTLRYMEVTIVSGQHRLEGPILFELVVRGDEATVRRVE
jgi:hypothetical protein